MAVLFPWMGIHRLTPSVPATPQTPPDTEERITDSPQPIPNLPCNDAQLRSEECHPSPILQRTPRDSRVEAAAQKRLKSLTLGGSRS